MDVPPLKWEPLFDGGLAGIDLSGAGCCSARVGPGTDVEDERPMPVG